MTYNEVLQKVDQVHQSISANKAKLRSFEQELQELNVSKENLSREHDKAVDTAKRSAYQRQTDAVVRDAEANIFTCNSKLKTLSDQLVAKKAKLTEENLRTEIFGDDDVEQEVQKFNNELNEELSAILSEDFRKRAQDTLEDEIPEISVDSFPEMLEEFNKVTSKIRKSKKFLKLSFIDKLNSIVVAINTEKIDQSGKNLAIFGVGLVIIIYFVAKWIFPFYVLFISVIIVAKLFHGSILKSALLSSLIVSANLEKIKAQQAEEIAKELERRTTILDSNYKKAYDEIQARISILKKELSDELEKVNAAFSYTEPAEQRQTFLTMLQSFDDRIEANKKSQLVVKDELAEMEKELVELDGQVEKAFGALKEEYLDPTKVGTSPLYDSKFLLDVTENGPSFYNHNRSSTMFLYDDSFEQATSLAKLIMYQVRVRMSPFSYNFGIHDKVYACKDFQAFADEKNELPVKFCSDAEAITKNIDALYQRRQKMINVLKANPGIDDYNKMMLELESVPEQYYFQFFFCASLNEISNEKMLSLAKVGGSLGIYLFSFVDYYVFKKEGKNAEAILDNYDQFYVIKNGKLFKKARDFVRNSILS